VNADIEDLSGVVRHPTTGFDFPNETQTISFGTRKLGAKYLHSHQGAISSCAKINDGLAATPEDTDDPEAADTIRIMRSQRLCLRKTHLATPWKRVTSSA